MNKMNMIMTGAVLACSLISAGCQDDTYEVKTPVYQSGLPANTLDASKFEKAFPLQYASYRQNDESSVMTEYKGSVNYRKNDNVNPLPKGFRAGQPYLKNLWLGYPFMYEYNEARGHTYAVKDILDIDRINRYLNGRLSAPGEPDAGQEYFHSSLARLADRYVRPEDRDRFRRELESIAPLTDPGSLQPLGEMTEENIMFQCSMILARIGSALSELGQSSGIRISNDKLFGMVIHILMSIPRWRKGISDREYASEQYKNDNIYVYEYLARQLREIASEYGLHIPDKEALALMRYFI